MKYDKLSPGTLVELLPLSDLREMCGMKIQFPTVYFSEKTKAWCSESEKNIPLSFGSIGVVIDEYTEYTYDEQNCDSVVVLFENRLFWVFKRRLKLLMDK